MTGQPLADWERDFLDRQAKREANEPPDHQWVTDHRWPPRLVGVPCCAVCGIIKRRDGENRPCRGYAPVELRAEPTDDGQVPAITAAELTFATSDGRRYTLTFNPEHRIEVDVESNPGDIDRDFFALCSKPMRIGSPTVTATVKCTWSVGAEKDMVTLTVNEPKKEGNANG